MAFSRKRGDTWHIYWTQNGNKRGRSLKTKSKAVAEAYLKEFEYDLSRKEVGQELDADLDSLRDEYPCYSKATKKATTYERHDVCRVPRFVSYLQSKGMAKVSEVTEAHVQAYQQQLLEWLSPRTVRHCMCAASGFLFYAVRQGYVRRNVVRNVPKVKATTNPPRHPEAASPAEEVMPHCWRRRRVRSAQTGSRAGPPGWRSRARSGVLRP